MSNKKDILPFFLNTDVSFLDLLPNESPFIKNMGFDFTGNPNLGLGTDNTTGEGQNLLVLTPLRSNERLASLPPIPTPEGFNKTAGAYYSDTTKELFYMNFNDRGKHGVYVIGGDDLSWKIIAEDPDLLFVEDQDAFMKDHRVSLRAVYDKDRNIVEEFLLITNGRSWQKYINVKAAIASSGFDPQNPYWKVQPPHFDRRELFEYPVRPPMYKPVVTKIDNTASDTGKPNRIIDKAFQFANLFVNTDGRSSTLSPYSNPLIVKSEDFNSNPDNLPKKASIKMYAGSPMTERIDLYVRQAISNKNSISTIIEYGDWYKYASVYKYKSTGVNSPSVIGNNYWLRMNPWVDNNYDPVFNTIDFVFDLSRVLEIVDQQDAIRLQNDMPLRSKSSSVIGDSNALGFNEYGYPNLAKEVVEQLDVEVVEKQSNICTTALRKIRLYAYIGQCGDDFAYLSQVGYYNGDDKQMRFGGINVAFQGTTIDIDESKAFELNFADRSALRCYLKGTPYFADGVWYQVNADNTLVKIDSLLDFGNKDVLTYAHNVFKSNGYFVCVFDLLVPQGRYIATLGRHNVSTSSDWRNTSTYILGIANSRVKSQTNVGGAIPISVTSIKPDAIGSFSKEMEVDCSLGDVDVWGNNADLFYVYCPYVTSRGNKKFRFIEGYLYESLGNPIPVDMFPYRMDHSALDDGGTLTDKNGFYFGYTKVANADSVSIQFQTKLNCQFPIFFIIPTSQTGIGFKKNSIAYLSDHNNGVVGGCNRIVFSGRMTDLTGQVGYANIAVSIKDGATSFTRSDGTFSLIVHNGLDTLRRSPVYVNAGGNFLLTLDQCAPLPVTVFDEVNSQCVNCNDRIYPINLNLAVVISGSSETSLKESCQYSVGCVVADLAGRLTFVNEIRQIEIPSFLDRANTNATFLRLLINGKLNLQNYPDAAWFFPCVSKNITQKRYVQWVGDSIKYIDSKGNVVTDKASAVFCSINITSLYDYNVSNNFSVLAKYQFVEGDRLRVLDDGNGNLLSTGIYGEEINVRVLGQNYNQAAINAGILPAPENTIVNSPSQTSQNISVNVIVLYDSRFDKLVNNSGFWIEIYTPAQQAETVNFCEVAGAYPIINGEVAIYKGNDAVGQPLYEYPTSIDLDYWDTYFLSRTIVIASVGDKFFPHPFESANISDNWGELCSSCGRQHIKNDNARQLWYEDDVIQSDDFVNEGAVNGLATFRSSNRKKFKGYLWGGIVAIIPQGSIILFICENDWFVTDFNFKYIFANEQGVQVANLDNKLSDPHQKIGSSFGCSLEDVGSIVDDGDCVYWYDRINEAYVKCDYRSAEDICTVEDDKGIKRGIKSYISQKTNFITEWNRSHPTNERFDVIVGKNPATNNILFTFRPRRNNTNDPSSYVNQRRNWQLDYQETLVYNIDTGRWIRTSGYTPEAYGEIRGNASGIDMVTFAAGVPYLHNNVDNDSYFNFFGQDTEPVISVIVNDPSDVIKILKRGAMDTTIPWIIDLVYSGNEKNSFSYVPSNYFKKKENIFYFEFLRDMMSYPNPDTSQLFRSMLMDGKRMFSTFFFIRFVGDHNNPNAYRELRAINIEAVDEVELIEDEKTPS